MYLRAGISSDNDDDDDDDDADDDDDDDDDDNDGGGVDGFDKATGCNSYYCGEQDWLPSRPN